MRRFQKNDSSVPRTSTKEARYPDRQGAQQSLLQNYPRCPILTTEQQGFDETLLCATPPAASSEPYSPHQRYQGRPKPIHRIAQSPSPRIMASSPATHASVNSVALDRSTTQPLGSIAEVLKMVTIQRDGVQHFDPAKIITGAGERVSDLSLGDALAELLSVIAATPQPADAVDMKMTGSMFAAFTSAEGSTAAKPAAALAVICKLATEHLWPATSADEAPHGGIRHLEGLILLPAPQRPPPASSTPQHQSQQPSTPPPQEIGDTETARSGSTRATSPPTRIPAARAELGQPC